MTTKGLTVWTLRVVVPVALAAAPVAAWVQQHVEQVKFAQDVVKAGADDELVVATPEELGLVAEEQAVAAQDEPQTLAEEPLAEEPLLADAATANLESVLEGQVAIEEPVVEETVVEADQVLLADASGVSASGSFVGDSLLAQNGEGGLGEFFFETPLGLGLAGAGAGGLGWGIYEVTKSEGTKDEFMSP